MVSMISQEDSDKVRDIIRSWLFFDLFTDKAISDKCKTFLHAFSEIASQKLSYKDGEKDMIMMKHIFKIETAEGRKRTLHSTYVGVGEPQGSGPTIMS